MQGFILPELVIESLIRDGLKNVQDDPTIIDSIFSQLTRSYNTRKYGTPEIDKIKQLILKEVAVVFSYHEVDQKPLSISIMVGSDTEHKPRAHLDDFYEEVQTELVDTEELEALHRVENINVLSYNQLTGQIIVADSTDLSPAYRYMIFVDASGTEFQIEGGICNDIGNKSFFIQKLAEVDFSTATSYIKSSLDYKRHEVRGVSGDTTLVLGCHSKDALTTKYLYILLKYFILSRKHDMIKRCMYLASYSGSDFGRDSQFLGDQVFTRFLTITAKVDDTWRSDQVVLIDNIEVDADPVE